MRSSCVTLERTYILDDVRSCRRGRRQPRAQREGKPVGQRRGEQLALTGRLASDRARRCTLRCTWNADDPRPSSTLTLREPSHPDALRCRREGRSDAFAIPCRHRVRSKLVSGRAASRELAAISGNGHSRRACRVSRVKRLAPRFRDEVDEATRVVDSSLVTRARVYDGRVSLARRALRPRRHPRRHGPAPSGRPGRGPRRRDRDGTCRQVERRRAPAPLRRRLRAALDRVSSQGASRSGSTAGIACARRSRRGRSSTTRCFAAYRRGEAASSVERLRLVRRRGADGTRRLRAGGLRDWAADERAFRRCSGASSRSPGSSPSSTAIAISEEIGAAKPDPEWAFPHRSTSLIGCEPAETAMVGDSPLYDITGSARSRLGARGARDPRPGRRLGRCRDDRDAVRAAWREVSVEVDRDDYHRRRGHPGRCGTRPADPGPAREPARRTSR